MTAFDCPTPRPPAGLTLVEILVALLLASLLAFIAITACLGAQRSFHHYHQRTMLAENGRFALQLLSRDLFMAGFLGGALPGSAPAAVTVGVDCTAEGWALWPGPALDFVDDYSGIGPPVAVAGDTFTCLDTAALLAGGDLLAIKRTAGAAAVRAGVVAGEVSHSSAERWYLRNEPGQPPQWQQVAPADLQSAALAFDAPDYWQAMSRIYYLRAYSRHPGDGIPALCAETLVGNDMTSRCLVEGIEDLQLEFGLDTDGDGVPNQFSGSLVAADLPRLVAARIHLLARSIDRVTGHRDDKSYTLGRKTHTPRADAYLRRVFSSTVRLRNRVHALAAG